MHIKHGQFVSFGDRFLNFYVKIFNRGTLLFYIVMVTYKLGPSRCSNWLTCLPNRCQRQFLSNDNVTRKKVLKPSIFFVTWSVLRKEQFWGCLDYGHVELVFLGALVQMSYMGFQNMISGCVCVALWRLEVGHTQPLCVLVVCFTKYFIYMPKNV
jgi:hypothetical protein